MKLCNNIFLFFFTGALCGLMHVRVTNLTRCPQIHLGNVLSLNVIVLYDIDFIKLLKELTWSKCMSVLPLSSGLWLGMCLYRPQQTPCELVQLHQYADTTRPALAPKNTSE